MIVERYNTEELVRKRCEGRRRTRNIVEHPSRPHEQFQLIRVYPSSKDAKRAAPDKRETLDEIEDSGEKCNSAAVQDLSNNDSNLTKKTIRLAREKESPESHSSTEGLAVHSEEKKVVSRWDTVRMETPVDEGDVKSPDSLLESELQDTVLEKNPGQAQPGNIFTNVIFILKLRPL